MSSCEEEASPIPLKPFPFGECNDLLLRDTLKSLVSGVRDTIRHYRSMGVTRTFLKDIESVMSPVESLDSSLCLDDDTDSSDNSNSIFDSPKCQEVSRMPEKPILKAKPPVKVDSDSVCELVKSVMSVEKPTRIDEEIITYVANCILTDHQYSRINFQKPLKYETQTQLTRFIKNLYIDKHVTTYTDLFYDQMMGCFLLHDMEISLENPGFYQTFDKIWKYDQEEMLCYDESYFRGLYMNSDELKLTVSKASITYAFFYNLKKFKYYSSRKIRLNRLANMDCSVDDASEEYIDLAQINKRALLQVIPARRSQIVVNFNSAVEVRTFDQEDPCNVFIE